MDERKFASRSNFPLIQLRETKLKGGRIRLVNYFFFGGGGVREKSVHETVSEHQRVNSS